MSQRSLRISPAILLLALCVQLWGADAITRAADVRRLGADEARRQLAVHLKGVVTWVNASSGELFVQDSSAGIFVFIRESTVDRPLVAGDSVVVDGVTAPGDFSSSVTNARIRWRGREEMPPGVHLPFERIQSGVQDSQWGHLEGIVRSGREEAGILFLNASTPIGPFLAILNEFPQDWQTSLVDSRISADGVLAAVFNDRRQVTGTRIFVPGRKYLHIDEIAPPDPFAMPQSSALSVGAFRPNEEWTHRIHVRVNVTAVVSKSLMYVAEGGEGNLAIALDGTCDAHAGSFVDAVGFPGTLDGRPALTNALCRVRAEGTVVKPLEISARDILPAESAELGSGLAIANGTRNDLRLVAVTGTLVHASTGSRGQIWTLASGDRNFAVTLPESVTPFEGSMDPGTLLRVTGVCLITFDQYHRAQSFRIAAREADDIAVISRPSWLTMSRALWIMVPMTVVVLASIAWIGVLRRHVAVKTNELREANERLQQSALEDALTGASNRGRFDTMLERELQHSMSKGTLLSLILIDIDYFKLVNDIYGHQRGDEYLIRTVRALRRAICPRDPRMVARYGGEEFAVLLPGDGMSAALSLAREIQAGFCELNLPHQRSPFDRRLTLSLGVASVAGEGDCTPEELVSMADRALYRAKQNGRNRVESFVPVSGFDPETSLPEMEWLEKSNGEHLAAV